MSCQILFATLFQADQIMSDHAASLYDWISLTLISAIYYCRQYKVLHSFVPNSICEIIPLNWPICHIRCITCCSLQPIMKFHQPKSYYVHCRDDNCTFNQNVNAKTRECDFLFDEGIIVLRDLARLPSGFCTVPKRKLH